METHFLLHILVADLESFSKYNKVIFYLIGLSI